MGAIDSALIAYKFLTSFAIVDKRIFMVHAVSKSKGNYAEGGGVGMIDDTSD